MLLEMLLTSLWH